MNNNVLDMTKGNPVKLMISFAIPIFLGNIFQQLYNIVDTMIAGNIIGDSALSAIGATASIYGLLVYMAVGMSGGFTIYVGRMFGEKNDEKLRNSIALAIVLSLLVGIVMTIGSLAFIHPLLQSIQTPVEIYQDAYNYISVILAGILITVAYNTESSILRAIGDSKTPFYFLIVSTLVNIVLDYLFIAILHLGVRGAALATVIAQAISALLCFITIYVKYPNLRLSKADFHFEKHVVADTFMLGLSVALMSSIVQIGSVILQSGINQLGDQTIAAHLVARKIFEISMMPVMTFAMAAQTFVAQNYGAKEYQRINDAIIQAIKINMVYCLFIELVILVGARFLVTFISGSNSTYIIDTAVYYLNINVPFFFALNILMVLRMSLQAIGQKIIPIISSVLELSCKVFATLVLTPMLGYLGVCVVEPLSWCLMALFLSLSYMIIKKKYLCIEAQS